MWIESVCELNLSVNWISWICYLLYAIRMTSIVSVCELNLLFSVNARFQSVYVQLNSVIVSVYLCWSKIQLYCFTENLLLFHTDNRQWTMFWEHTSEFVHLNITSVADGHTSESDFNITFRHRICLLSVQSIQLNLLLYS